MRDLERRRYSWLLHKDPIKCSLIFLNLDDRLDFLNDHNPISIHSSIRWRAAFGKFFTFLYFAKSWLNRYIQLEPPLSSLSPKSWQTGARDVSRLEPHVLCFLSLCFIILLMFIRMESLDYADEWRWQGPEEVGLVGSRRVASLGMFLYIYYFFFST